MHRIHQQDRRCRTNKFFSERTYVLAKHSVQCKNNSCTARHPKPCKYPVKFGVFKFGLDFYIFHSTDVSEKSGVVKDAPKLKENLDLVLESLKTK